jgi:hypothetical protein
MLPYVSDLVRVREGNVDVVAAWKSSISMILPIVLSPLLGLFFSRFGGKTYAGTSLAVLLKTVMIIL